MSIVTEKHITEIVESLLTDDAIFIVDVSISNSSGKMKIAVALDGDEGIGVDECGNISRELGNTIEEHEMIDTPYHLEVSSPGLDQPLKFTRQYVKNIGRDVRVLLQDTKEIKGTLEEVKDNGIVVREQVKGKNKKQTSYSKETTVISFNDINKTNILIQF